MDLSLTAYSSPADRIEAFRSESDWPHQNQADPEIAGAPPGLAAAASTMKTRGERESRQEGETRGRLHAIGP